MSNVEVEAVTGKDAPDESPMNRFRKGDKVAYSRTVDSNGKAVWPPEHMEGKVKSFNNVEGTYLNCEFGDEVLTLTEDEVTRIG